MSIQDLIDTASSGDIINIMPGIYNEQLIIDKPLTLLGPEIDDGIAIIDGSGLTDAPTIHISSSNITIDKLTIQNGPTHGIFVGSDTALDLHDIVISNNNIKGHGNAGIITFYNASMIIDSNNIENNGIGTGFNRGGIILYPNGATTIANNTISNNTIEGIFARESADGLIIENNKIINHSNSGITLAWDQINTSIIDNTIENCGTGATEEQGGIVIIQSMAETIKGNIIKNCKHSGIFWGWVPSTIDSPGEILIKSNIIDNSSRDGIFLFSQGPGGFIEPDSFPLEPEIKSNIIINNVRVGVYVSDIYYYSPGNANPTINCNEIVGNGWGVYNGTAQIVNAKDNWWGDNSGPFQETINPEGKGNPVSTNVDFTPWIIRQKVEEVADCSIRSVTLENYEILGLNDHLSKLNLIIKVMGDVSIKDNNEIDQLNFEKWFTENVVVNAPPQNKAKVFINHKSKCYASLIDNNIQIEIELCIQVSIKGDKYSMLIPSFGLCIPRPCEEVDGQHTNKIIKSIEHIDVAKIYSSCWFTKNLLHNINIV